MARDDITEEQKAALVGRDKISPDGSISHVLIVPGGRESLSKALPPHETYEGRHRWDPNAMWSEKEETRLVWKTDFYLLGILCVMVCLDKGRICNQFC